MGVRNEKRETLRRLDSKAVNNYTATFARCVHLKRKDVQAGQIAFLLPRGKPLIQQYLDIITERESDKNMSYHLDQLMRLGPCSGGGNSPLIRDQ